MPSLSYIFLDYICPSIGITLSCSMVSAPVKALMQSLERGSLRELNPTPWALMTGHAIGWVYYSFLISDFFIFAANAPGLLVSMWLNTNACKLQYLNQMKQRVMSQPTKSTTRNGHNGLVELDISTGEVSSVKKTSIDHMIYPPSLSSDIPLFVPHELNVMLVVIVWIIIISTTSLAPITTERRKYIVGILVNINLIFYFTAPLSTIRTVLQSRNSKTIHVRTMVTNTANAFFWCLYGLSLLNPVIFVPNGIGVLLGIVQAFLCLSYPGHASTNIRNSEESLDKLHASKQTIDKVGEMN